MIKNLLSENETETFNNYEIRKNGKLEWKKPDTTINKDHESDCVIYYSGLKEIKRSYFKCTGVTYNEENGKIESMSFTQLDEK